MAVLTKPRRTPALLAAAFCWSVCFASASPPTYKLGDIASEDVVTPVTLSVVNPEATEALKQNLLKQLPFVTRHHPRGARDAETALRDATTRARKLFQARLQNNLQGHTPSESDIGSTAYIQAVAETAGEGFTDLPFDTFAPLWTQGISDEDIVKSLLQPIREVMAQVIIDTRGDRAVPANQTLRLVPVASLETPPSFQDIERATQTLPSGRITSLWRARRLVETSFPDARQALGKFAAGFVIPNALPDPESTELLRTRRLEGITANDTYEPAQIIVARGQVIDRKALNALAVLREKNLISTLQNQLEQQQAPASPPSASPGDRLLVWIAAGLGTVILLLLVIYWRLRARIVNTLIPVFPQQTLAAGDSPPALGDGSVQSLEWRQRALTAEASAHRAQEAIRSGMLGWMKDKIVHTLFRQRTELLAVQQKAEAEMRELEARLQKVHAPLQERLRAYARRIEELENELAAKGETNRHLLDARIAAVRQQMQVERDRVETK